MEQYVDPKTQKCFTKCYVVVKMFENSPIDVEVRVFSTEREALQWAYPSGDWSQQCKRPECSIRGTFFSDSQGYPTPAERAAGWLFCMEHEVKEPHLTRVRMIEAIVDQEVRGMGHAKTEEEG
jgi:hypothetical protein